METLCSFSTLALAFWQLLDLMEILWELFIPHTSHNQWRYKERIIVVREAWKGRVKLTTFRFRRDWLDLDGSGGGVKGRRDFGDLAGHRSQGLPFHQVATAIVITIATRILPVPGRRDWQRPAAARVGMHRLRFPWNSHQTDCVNQTVLLTRRPFPTLKFLMNNRSCTVRIESELVLEI